jgi:hypothetical protein
MCVKLYNLNFIHSFNLLKKLIINNTTIFRVAGAFFADFHIPGDLSYLWKYMKLMYSLDAFIQSVPADQVNSSMINLVQVLGSLSLFVKFLIAFQT